jgi:hypothetical protein
VPQFGARVDLQFLPYCSSRRRAGVILSVLDCVHVWKSKMAAAARQAINHLIRRVRLLVGPGHWRGVLAARLHSFGVHRFAPASSPRGPDPTVRPRLLSRG